MAKAMVIHELLPMFSRLWRLGIINSNEKTRLANLAKYTCRSDSYADAIQKELMEIRSRADAYGKQEIDSCISAMYQ